MKIISFFNHKGGVCKTTTTYHLGWKLSQKGKRVLLVDADSQCNLTLSVIGEDNYEQFFTDNPLNNIKNCLSYAFDSKPELIPAAECVPVKNQDNLFLLPGNFDITEFEVQLSVSFQLTSSFSTMKNLPGSFYYLLQKTAEKLKIDYVLVDLNPSLSAINQDFIVSSDYIIIPASPDYFSLMAIKSIARILPNWEKWAKQARNIFNDSTYPLPNHTPQFLGYTINDYTIRKGKPAEAFKNIIDKINSIIIDELVPNLKNVGMLLSEDKYKSNDIGNYLLASISNFQTLQAQYQKYGVPVFALSDAQIGTTGDVLANQKKKITDFDREFSSFADKVLKMTSDE
jgi:cellulose biosynthesis protein BcsQ